MVKIDPEYGAMGRVCRRRRCVALCSSQCARRGAGCKYPPRPRETVPAMS